MDENAIKTLEAAGYARQREGKYPKGASWVEYYDRKTHRIVTLQGTAAIITTSQADLPKLLERGGLMDEDKRLSPSEAVDLARRTSREAQERRMEAARQEAGSQMDDRQRAIEALAKAGYTYLLTHESSGRPGSHRDHTVYIRQFDTVEERVRVFDDLFEQILVGDLDKLTTILSPLTLEMVDRVAWEVVAHAKSCDHAAGSNVEVGMELLMERLRQQVEQQGGNGA